MLGGIISELQRVVIRKYFSVSKSNVLQNTISELQRVVIRKYFSASTSSDLGKLYNYARVQEACLYFSLNNLLVSCARESIGLTDICDFLKLNNYRSNSINNYYDNNTNHNDDDIVMMMLIMVVVMMMLATLVIIIIIIIIII